MTSPSIMARLVSMRPITVRKVTLLPEPDSPTTPSVSPGSERERDAVDGLHEAVVGREVDAEVLDLQERLRHYVYLTRGSRNA